MHFRIGQNHLQSCLNLMVKQQIKEGERDALPQHFHDKPGEIFEWYGAEPRFDAIVREAKGKLVQNASLERERLVGRMFQDIAYSFFLGIQPSYCVLLSPSRTHFVYQAVYPLAKTTQHGYGLSSIDGVSVPDGLVVEKQNGICKVIATCEYTASNTFNHRGKHHGMMKVRSECSIFSKECELVYVHPKVERFPQKALEAKHVSLQETPFTLEQYQKFFEKSIYLIARDQLLN